MSTTAEPPANPNVTTVQPMEPLSRQGIVGVADAFKLAAASPVESKPASAPEPLLAPETKPQAKPALLESLSVEPVKTEPKPISKTTEAFNAVKAEREQFRAEAETLRKQVAEAEGWKKELETLKPKALLAEEYDKRLRETAFEKSDAFRAIVAEQEGVLNNAKALAKEFEAPEEAVNQALLLKGKKRFDFLRDTFGEAASKFDNFIEQYESKEAYKATELARSREKSQKENSDESARLAAEQQRQRSEIVSAFERKLPAFAEKLPGYFQKKEGDDERNAIVEATITTARNIAESDDPDTQTEAMALAAVAHSIIPRYAAAQKEVAALRKRVEELTGNTPAVKTGTQEEGNGNNGRPLGMLDRFKRGGIGS
jgi:hypothetical protein